MSFSRTDPDALRQALQSAGLWARKGLGQHFLIDDRVLDDIMAAAGTLQGERVVEVGPGPGALTERLLLSGAIVTAFEYDPGMCQFLLTEFNNLDLQKGDILKKAPEAINFQIYSVVANVPYNITNPLLRMFLEGIQVPRPGRMVLMLQREVGERLAAAPGKPGRGYLSVLAQYFAEVTLVRTVAASSFWPEPKVQSAVVKLVSRSERIVPPAQEQKFLRFVRQLCINPRKQLKNVVAGIRGLDPAEVQARFSEVGLSGNVRSQELGLEEWARLYSRFAAV